MCRAVGRDGCVCFFCFFLCFFFLLLLFFQAEDGIRDLVRSRGLGDVYKRQEWKLRGPVANTQARSLDVEDQ